ncbi:hypothetical protein [Bacterioplanoides sp.]|uniref:hypothetical protein n=1 Tax=Bacterioplanoides sp. TaxID=2066072 RepID=UPI003AFFD380
MYNKKSGIAAVLLISGQLSYANDLNINGFMSAGAGVLTNDDVSAAGYDDDVSFTQDTVVALQVSKQINDSTSATTQFIARGEEDYNTENAWAYVTYSFNDNTDIRLGRLRTPFFYYSDFLEVGYAYNWIRPPGEVYSRLDTFSSINGVDLTHNFTAGSADGSVQVYFGRLEDSFAPVEEAFEIDLRNFAGAVLSLNKDNWGTRLSYHQADVYMPDLMADPTGDALEQLVAGATALGLQDEFTPDGDTTRFYEAAITYDNGSTFLIAEWTALDHETDLLLNDQAFLISAAQRFNDTTVHLTYSEDKDEKQSGNVGLLQNNLRGEESSITLGARFDYNAGTAFKVEAQYIDEELRLGNDGESAMLYSVAVDLVF